MGYKDKPCSEGGGEELSLEYLAFIFAAFELQRFTAWVW